MELEILIGSRGTPVLLLDEVLEDDSALGFQVIDDVIMLFDGDQAIGSFGPFTPDAVSRVDGLPAVSVVEMPGLHQGRDVRTSSARHLH